MKPDLTAQEHFHNHLQQNPYPGRGLVIGRASRPDTWLMIYWIMGRSTNSRNRRFIAEKGLLRTEPVDLKLVKDPSLIIYEAMLELPGFYLASNGDQTRTMYETLKKGGTLQEALADREREPDAPNFTPRINGLLAVKQDKVSCALAILKANPIDQALTDRFYYYPVIPEAGYGFGLTTYSGDGDPLPSFSGDPILLPCKGNGKEVLESYWDALNTENRVSLAVKEIKIPEQRSEIYVKNRF